MIGVCIPAHDEEAHIGSCLDSVLQASAHPALLGEKVALVLVLDNCTDDTASIAMNWPVTPLAITARNVGKARAAGAEHLLQLGARWLAFTDADSRVSPRWLVDQLSLQADVVCGTVEASDWSTHGVHAPCARRQFESTYTDCDGHRHVHGANLGVSAWHYRQVGGFEARTCSEDQALVDRLARHGARIAWSAAPRVWTSARPHSRVEGGFATALRRSWQAAPHQQTGRNAALAPMLMLTTEEVPRPATGLTGGHPSRPRSGD